MLDMVHCKYNIGALVLRVHHEGKSDAENKDKCGILKEVAANKY